MKIPTFNVWFLCLAIAAVALLMKLAILFGVSRAASMLLPFVGPLVGVSHDLRRGGNAVAGGLLGGMAAGMVWCVIGGMAVSISGQFLSWPELIGASVFVIGVYGFIGLLVGSLCWMVRASIAAYSAASSKGN